MIRILTELTKKKFIVINIAYEIGICKAAELFNLNRRSIRNWINKYEKGGLEELQNKSRQDQPFKNKMPKEIVRQILKLKIIHPEYSVKKIKEVLDLDCSINTIYKKLKLNYHLLKTHNKVNTKRNVQSKIFSDFFVSIKKIKYCSRSNHKKFPKYLVLIEERVIGVTFCSFSDERTSLSVAIFLEYFIELLKQSDVNINYNFHISSSIKLSSNDLIDQIVKNKHQCKLIKNYRYSDFVYRRKENLYKYLFNNLILKLNSNNSKEEFRYKVSAYTALFNSDQIENYTGHFSAKSDKVKKLTCNISMISTDQFVTNISEIKSKPDYFWTDYSKRTGVKLTTEMNLVNSTIQYLKDKGYRAQKKYNYDVASKFYLTTRSLCIHYIEKIEISLNELNDSPKLQLNSIVENLLEAILGLSTIYKEKGLINKERKFLIEGIKYSSKYDFYKIKMKSLNKLANLDVAFQNREKSLKIIKFVIKNTDHQSENHLKAKMLLGNYYKGKDNINIALKIYDHVLNRIKDQYPILKIRILTTIARTYLSINRFDDTKLYCEKAIKISNNNQIDNYDIKIQDHLGIYYFRTGDFERSIQCFKKAIKLSSERSNVVTLNRNSILLSNVYHMQGKYDKAISIIKSVLPSIQEIKDHETEIRSLQNISKVYLELKKYKISEDYADKAIFLADYLKDHNQYFLSLICKINILFQKFDLKKIIALQQIFIKMKDKIEYTSTIFIANLISFRVKLLKLLFGHETEKEKNIIDIFSKINSEIENQDSENEEKSELTFLYCRLYKL